MSSLQGFGLKAFKKYWELIPLVTSLGFAGCLAVGFSMYAAATKSDVRINKRNDTPPWERVNPNKQQKMFAINQKYRANVELENLREEIGSYKY